LREVVCPVLKLREEKWTFVIVGGGKIDFFHSQKVIFNTENRKKTLYNL
jgi:hypothetical protein